MTENEKKKNYKPNYSHTPANCRNIHEKIRIKIYHALRSQQSMPPADTAVKIANALGLSVEYLVTGKEYLQTIDISKYLQFKDLLDDLALLPEETLEPIKAVIKSFADGERKRG